MPPQRRAALVLLCAFLAPSLAHGQSAPALVVTAGYHYLPGDDRTPEAALRIDEGSTLIFGNVEGDLHSFTSYEINSAGHPIFDTGALQPGNVRNVEEVSTLAPGAHRFYCTVHTSMEGTLYVDPR